MKAKIIRDTLSLVAITLVAAVCLSFVHELTADTIAKAEAEERLASYREVFPEVASFEDIDDIESLIGSVSLPDGVTVGEAKEAVDGEGNPLGCVVSATSSKGYGGNVTLSVGIGSDGVITGMSVTSMSESPGFGSHCQDEEFQEQFKGISGEVTYTDSGKSQPNEIDMISGATFTTSAVTDAVNGALAFAEQAGFVRGGDE